MKQRDQAFDAFCELYQQEDFDGAAAILYKEIVKALHEQMQLNPLIKPDLSFALEKLAKEHMPLPTPDAFHHTIDEVVKYLQATHDLDMQTMYN